MSKARSVSFHPSRNTLTTNHKYANLKLDIANDYRIHLDPIKSFKNFLQKIIDKKNEEISYQNSNSVQEEEEVMLHQPRKSQIFSSNFVELKRASFPKLIENDDKEKKINIQEQLERIKRKNEIIALATKKFKTKYKLEKIDKAVKFNNNKLKAFTNLSTFINAKEHIECLSPLLDEKHKTKQYLNSNNMYKLQQKLQNESPMFLEGKQKEFLQRLNELEPVDEKAEETKSKDNQSRSSSFADGKSSQKKGNSKIIPKTTQINGFEIKDNTSMMGIKKKKEEKRKASIRFHYTNEEEAEEEEDFVRSPKQKINSDNSFPKSPKQRLSGTKSGHNLRIKNIEPDFLINAVDMEEKKQKIDVFDEESQTLKKKRVSGFKKMKTFEEVNTYSTSREIMNFIIRNDELFQKSDHLQENDGIYEDKLDGFYNELNTFINNQKSKKSSAKYETNMSKQVDSLEKLEKIVSGIIKSKYKIKENYNVKEEEEPKITELKYKDFQHKSNELIKLMTKTSRKLLDLEFSKNSNAPINLKNIASKIGISTPSHFSKTSNKPYRKLNSLLSKKNSTHSRVKSESEKFDASHNDLGIKEKKIHLKKQSLSNLNLNYKDPNQEIENILFSCSDLYKKNGSERVTLQKMKADAESFFITTQNKINPNIDSILGKIEKKKVNAKPDSILEKIENQKVNTRKDIILCLKKLKGPLTFL